MAIEAKRLTTPEGLSGFSALTSPRMFKNIPETSAYSQEIILPREEGLKFLEVIKKEIAVLYAGRIEQMKAAGKAIKPTPPEVDYKETVEGDIVLNFKRKEKLGAPAQYDKNNKRVSGVMVSRGHKIQVSFLPGIYIIPSKVGVVLTLLGVKIVDTSDPHLSADLFGPEIESKDPVVNAKAKDDIDLF